LAQAGAVFILAGLPFFFLVIDASNDLADLCREKSVPATYLTMESVTAGGSDERRTCRAVVGFTC
jgi:hypothetical protein